MKNEDKRDCFCSSAMELVAVMMLKSSFSLDMMLLLLCNSTSHGTTHIIAIYISTYRCAYLPVCINAYKPFLDSLFTDEEETMILPSQGY